MKLQTLEEALALVPEHFMLKAGDILKSDDEYFADGQWFKEQAGWFGKPIDSRMNGFIHRRPIPQKVRESEARWILYNSLATVDPINFGYVFALEAEYDEEGFVVAGHRFKKTDQNFGMRKFPSKEAAEAALKVFDTYKNGQSDLIEMLNVGPGALWRWLGDMNG